jgi:peptide/nickel transport system permease protein
MATVSQTQAVGGTPRSAGRTKSWRSPWLNGKLLSGLVIFLAVLALGLLGPLFWDVKLAFVASSPTNLPPAWVSTPSIGSTKVGDVNHPLGTESNGRDMLAAAIVGTPASLRVGFLAAGVGMLVAVVLGSAAGYFGGIVDDVIRTLSDSWIVIPSLAVLITLSAYVRVIDLNTMAFVLALFAWPGPTRLMRAQVLTLRERGYVRMAMLSGVPPLKIIFVEMAPNLLPWLAATFTGVVSAAILAAASLEALGLGPTRIPTLGMIIHHAINSSAIFRGMWWWWGVPIVILILIFTSLFLITTGLDEIANPRLRGDKP